MVEIQETGSYFEIDKDGFLMNPASVDNIQDEWQPVVDEVIELYKKYFSDSLISVYLRGSVSKGEAIKNVSDVDSWAYVDLERDEIETEDFNKEKIELEKKYSFSESIEAGVAPVEKAKEEQFWIAQAVAVYGKDLQTERFKIGKEIMKHSRQPEKIRMRLNKNLAREDSEKNRFAGCTWLCKQILRSVIELCFERSGKYSRDLYRCWETFSEYYPDKSEEMKHVLHLALNPISDEKEITALEEKWTKWIVEEKERLRY